MDDKIIAFIKQRQEQGISLLLGQYGGLMKLIIRKYIAGRPQEIEECMADTIIAIWYHIDDFDASKNSLKNWVAAITKFKAIDVLRKLERQQQTTELSEQLPTTTKEVFDWESLLTELPLQERQIFQQYYFEGKATKEIATQHDAKESWVHNKLSRSRKKLKTLFIRDEV
ncbi:sigma-70 family RNA polymerase sigma factor [Metasolibacillus meyeri]|uniref:Sigma-70 family RNA polymerase sigma factor n=1 Tax=Metasolibacillus meyeri TaxID=1071052 RepID=A0AAW9NMW7_9BACL|nr:sigma-70 family RNA polymerase sigma factor [Metasolibacillus meyeri]MEC1177792.1 sigma-70 family RNA polymerase sigma factor [Metasolibacillus meyeri]